MTPMKRFVPAALLLMGVALLGATPALAAGGSVVLTPTGVEPTASGRATLSNVQRPYPPSLAQYKALLAVQCEGLTPNATYSVYRPRYSGNPGGDMVGVANETGTLSLSGSFYFSGSQIWVSVRNAEGVVVLTGTIRSSSSDQLWQDCGCKEVMPRSKRGRGRGMGESRLFRVSSSSFGLTGDKYHERAFVLHCGAETPVAGPLAGARAALGRRPGW